MSFPKKIAYLISQYPKVSHSFVRREILELEQQGFAVQRLSVRGWDGDLVDPVDIAERQKTRYVLQAGIKGLLKPTWRVFRANPKAWIQTFVAAVKMGLRADRGWPYHLIYVAEACLVLEWLRQEGSQHLHVHFGANATEVAMLVRLLGGPTYSFTVHGPEEFDKPEFIKLPEKIKHAAFVVAITSYCRSQLFRWIPYHQWYKIKEVHCGLEKSFYDVDATVLTDKPRIVCVGRLCEQKGQLLLVDAVHQLVAKGIPVELVLGGDGEMRAQIEERIRAYGISQHVRITGWISSEQVRDEILAAKALVLPSFAEGLPVVIMESMALRRPVLSTYIAGIPELVHDQVHGYLFPAGDVDALAQSIEQLLTLSGDELQSMGAAAFEQVLARHAIEAEVKKLALHLNACFSD